MFELINDELTNLLQSDGWEAPTQMVNRLALTDGDNKFTLQTGYSDAPPTFLLDFDMYSTGKLPPENLSEQYLNFHDKIYDAFRWCITDEAIEYFNNHK